MNLPELQDGEDKTSPLKNRLRKQFKHLRKWAKKADTNCFRLYSTDIKQFPCSIDIYGKCFYVQFFFSKQDGERKDLQELITKALVETFTVSPEEIFYRTRIKRARLEQYEKVASEKAFFPVVEHGTKFLVNLDDYLDTGLFLDHRTTRQIVAKHAVGKTLLNLFAYTCSFSVQAGVLGALSTKSVDLSNTYTSWGKKNLALNKLSAKNHAVIREDCMVFLEKAAFENTLYDVIVIDPPTLSRSKKMDSFFSVDTDYPVLIGKSLPLLAPGGVLFFSTNSRKFSFDDTLFPHCKVEEITHKTLPEDFQGKQMHRCWKIEK